MPPDFTLSSRESYLDLFDRPVRKEIEKAIRQIGYDPDILRPVILAAIENAKAFVENGGIYSSLALPSLKAMLQEQALLLVIAVLRQSKKFKSAAECIRSYNAIIITGAGLSFESGIPLTEVLVQLLRFCEAKDYNELKNDQKKCLKFKTEFARICAAKNPTTSHESIAHNCGTTILEVICLNWDNLLERAKRYPNKEIPKINNEDEGVSSGSHIWKFHGDVENIKESNIIGRGGWVFPGEEGYVFHNFLSYIETTKLKDQMFTLVIVGYSEQEKEIYEKVIVPLEKIPPRPTFRIGLDLGHLHQENYLVGPADYVLEEIMPPT